MALCSWAGQSLRLYVVGAGQSLRLYFCSRILCDEARRCDRVEELVHFKHNRTRAVETTLCLHSVMYVGLVSSSSSRMRVIYHNWSAMKQRPHPQSIAEISRHSVLSGDRIRQCETSSGSRHKDTDQCL